MLSAFSVFVLFVVLFALIFVILAVQRVPQGNEWTVERFGRYVRTLEPGLALIVPVVDRVGARMNMMETVLDVPSQSVITRDNAVVTVDAIVFYQVLDAAKAAYEVTTLELAILNLVMTNIRTVMGSMSLDELLSERDRINSQLLTVVDAATTPWGVKVQRVEIKDITPPQELVAAMARQMKAEREKRANVLEAEGFKQAAVLKAEGEKQAVILAAEARREAAFRDAEARERQAEAEASATTSVSEAIGRGSIQAINYFVAQRYIDAIGRLAGSQNQKVILMPLESASMIGSLAGIAELARESFGTARAAANPAVGGRQRGVDAVLVLGRPWRCSRRDRGRRTGDGLYLAGRRGAWRRGDLLALSRARLGAPGVDLCGPRRSPASPSAGRLSPTPEQVQATDTSTGAPRAISVGCSHWMARSSTAADGSESTIRSGSSPDRTSRPGPACA